MRLLHIITCLDQGGAEAALYRLVSASPSFVRHTVVSMLDEGIYGLQLRECGATVHTLGMARGRLTLRGLRRLYRIVRQAKPDVVQTWMYHADLVGGVVARLAGVRAVVWGIRHTNLDPEFSSFRSRAVASLCVHLSGRVPAAIACNAREAARVHQALGYRADRFAVIPNGYDLGMFSPDKAGRHRVREEWGIGPREMLLGMVARWDPQKDHTNLLRALGLLAGRGMAFRCALVGSGMAADNRSLSDLIRKMGLQDRVILGGPRDDIPALMNALDLHVLSSANEAFPNVVAEAMACGTPCVVTDVGDASVIVGDTGWVASPRNAPELAERIQDAFEALAGVGHELISERCRARIVEKFSLQKMVDAYLALWMLVANKTKG